MKIHPFISLIVVTLLTGAGSQSAAQEKSWKGESVVPIKHQKDITFGDNADGKQIYFTFFGRDWPITVRDDRDGWLRINDGRREGWADKSQFVLARDAPAYFNRRIQADPNDTWAVYMCGVVWLGMGEPDKAIKDLNECIRLAPTVSTAFSNRGTAWQGKSDYDRAIKDYDEAIRLDPENTPAFFNRGLAWSNKKNYDRAIKDYDEAIRLDPKLAWAFNNRGFAWSSKKDYDRAIKDYDEAIRLDPKFASAFNNRGYAWSNKKDNDRAIKDYDEAIRLDPKFAWPFNNRGFSWSSKKDYDRAIKDYDEAIRLDPKDAVVFYNRSVAQLLSRQAKAVGGFQAVLDLEGWKGHLATYAVLLGHFAALQSDNQAAAKRFLADSAGKLAEDWPYPVVRFLRGEIDEPALLKLATDDDKRTEARCFLGLDYLLKGRKDEALVHFRWVKEHGTASLTEYIIAVAELERLERGDK